MVLYYESDIREAQGLPGFTKQEREFLNAIASTISKPSTMKSKCIKPGGSIQCTFKEDGKDIKFTITRNLCRGSGRTFTISGYIGEYNGKNVSFACNYNGRLVGFAHFPFIYLKNIKDATSGTHKWAMRANAIVRALNKYSKGDAAAASPRAAIEIADITYKNDAGEDIADNDNSVIWEAILEKVATDERIAEETRVAKLSAVTKATKSQGGRATRVVTKNESESEGDAHVKPEPTSDMTATSSSTPAVAPASQKRSREDDAEDVVPAIQRVDAGGPTTNVRECTPDCCKQDCKPCINFYGCP